MPSLLSYHTDRAVAQADVNGSFKQRPRAWRFAVVRIAPGEALAFSPEQSEMVAQDHVNCLYRLRSCEAEETVLLDRLGGQTALAKFMLEADRPASVDPEQAWRSFTELADRVLAAMDGAFGARALFLNRVVYEIECEPLDVEGQRPIGVLEETTRVGYIEAYFDHPAGARRRWASSRATGRWAASATWWTSTSCGSKRRPRSRHGSRRPHEADGRSGRGHHGRELRPRRATRARGRRRRRDPGPGRAPCRAPRGADAGHPQRRSRRLRRHRRGRPRAAHRRRDRAPRAARRARSTTRAREPPPPRCARHPRRSRACSIST